MKKLPLIFLIVFCTVFCAVLFVGCEYFVLPEPVHRHMYDEWVITKNRTCTEDGERERYCSCGEKQTGVMASLGHDYIEYEEKPATCTEEGHEAYRQCRRCGDGTEKITMPALNHALENFVAENATCTKAGHAEYEYCTRCNYSTFVEIPPLGHAFGEWEEVKSATCTEHGEERRVCAHDESHTETRTTEKISHVIKDFITQETCETDGLKYRECTVCGLRSDSEIIPARGHDFSEWTTMTEPTCTQEGLETRVCNNDETHTETRTVEKLPHALSEWITEIQHSCEKDGLKFRECAFCKIRIESEIIPAAGHVAGGWITDVEEDCESDGAKHTECTVCEKVLETEVVSAHGHNFADDVCIYCGLDAAATKGLVFGLLSDGNSYAVLGIENGVSEIIIPETYRGKPVTAIMSEAFRGLTELEKIFIPASVTEIGQYAFDGCENLEEAEFAVPDGWVFYNAGGVKIAEVSETEITSSAAEILTNIHLNKYFLFRA